MSADLGGSVAAAADAAQDWLGLVADAAPIVSAEVPDIVVGRPAADAAQDGLGLVADELCISGQQDAVPPDRDPAELAVVAVPHVRDLAELAVASVADATPRKRRLPAPNKRNLTEHQLVSANMHLAKLRKKVRLESQSQGINSNHTSGYSNTYYKTRFVLQA